MFVDYVTVHLRFKVHDKMECRSFESAFSVISVDWVQLKFASIFLVESFIQILPSNFMSNGIEKCIHLQNRLVDSTSKIIC